MDGRSVFEARDKASGQEDAIPDYVTRHDMFAEALIRTSLKATRPELMVVGEEGDKSGVSQTSYFLVDPCDGTKNFALGIPYFAICIAHIVSEKVIAGVVYDPIEHKLYSAETGQGSFIETPNVMSPRIIKCSPEIDSRRALLVTEESYGDSHMQETSMQRLAMLAPHFAGVRKFGSTALDLARLAASQPIVVVASGLKSWDFAAGQIIATEAGAYVKNMTGQPLTLQSTELLAAPSRPLMDNVLKYTKGQTYS